jgi:hypothetical protein
MSRMQATQIAEYGYIEENARQFPHWSRSRFRYEPVNTFGMTKEWDKQKRK